MINRQELLELARELSLRPNVVEKDYALGWLLAGIGQHPATKDSWVFKGGTCLKKCHFETYRFSEDLDFTLLDETHLNEDFLTTVFGNIAEWVYEKSGLELPKENIKFELYQNPRGKPSVLGRISYRGPIAPGGDLPRIKLDLTSDEKVVLKPQRMPVRHGYSDVPLEGIEILCYPYEEVFAEKVRALAERELPRDLYDVVHLYRHPEMHPDRQNIFNIIQEKCRFKNIPFPTLEKLKQEPQRTELETEWSNMLAHQLPTLPPFQQFWNELSALFDWLTGRVKPVELKPIGAEANEDTMWSPPPVAQVWGMRVPLEVIRFAAANRLCVNLGYQGTKRLIEPYSLRRTKNGDMLLHALRVEDRQHRSYKIHEIESAEVMQRVFTPVYTVELSPSGPIHAPMQSRSSSYSSIGRSSFLNRRPKRSPSSSFGPKYIFQCGLCGKKFTKLTNNGTLRRHKGPLDMMCAGRTGYLVEMR